MDAVKEITNEDFLLRSISDGTSSETGSEFFRALAKNLSQALGTYGAWVTEYLPEVKRKSVMGIPWTFSITKYGRPVSVAPASCIAATLG